MSWIISIFSIILMIIVHEWGHFIAGRICKIPIYEFSIGMGPLLWQKKSKKDTKFSIRALPIGGYCAFDNMEEISDTKNGVLDLALDKLPFHKRVFICAAGPLMNIFMAFVITFIMLLCAGNVVSNTEVIGVVPDSPAVGILENGDIVTHINGLYVEGNPELLSETLNLLGTKLEESVKITLIRNEESIEVEMTPYLDSQTGNYFLGFYKGYRMLPMNPIEALTTSVKTTTLYVTSTLDSLAGLFTGKYSLNDVSSIVGAVVIMEEYATIEGIFNFLTLVCLISINIGVLNLLPIPALDGSKILIALIEKIIGRNLNQEKVAKATFVGFSILMVFGFFMIFIDIANLINL